MLWKIGKEKILIQGFILQYGYDGLYIYAELFRVQRKLAPRNS